MRPLRLLAPLRRFIGNGQGNIAIMFGFLLVPLAVAGGMGVDFAQAQHFRNILQGAADAAALAGASAYKSAATSATATTIATNYMTNAVSTLPERNDVSFTVTPGTVTSGDSTTGYTMAVSVTAKVPTAFMELASIGSMNVGATATAENPVTTASVNLNGFSSSACDGNTIYWFLIPTGSNASTYVPTTSELTEIWTNTVSNPPPPAPFTLTSSSQQIGFALKNVTGQLCSYGNNQYGGKQGATHMIYSNLFPPSEKAYPSVTTNRSLQVVPLPSGETQAQVVNGLPRQTFTSNFTYAAPTCGALNGQTMVYAWNDMGGETDDLDYNDAAYTFTCTGASGSSVSNASGVVLVK